MTRPRVVLLYGHPRSVPDPALQRARRSASTCASSSSPRGVPDPPYRLHEDEIRFALGRRSRAPISPWEDRWLVLNHGVRRAGCAAPTSVAARRLEPARVLGRALRGRGPCAAARASPGSRAPSSDSRPRATGRVKRLLARACTGIRRPRARRAGVRCWRSPLPRRASRRSRRTPSTAPSSPRACPTASACRAELGARGLLLPLRRPPRAGRRASTRCSRPSGGVSGPARDRRLGPRG